MKSALLKCCFRLIALLPLSWSRGLGRAIGRLTWWSNGTAAAVTRENIRLCFPDLDPDSQHKLAKDSLRETGRMALETPAVWYRGHDWRLGMIRETQGADLFDQALADHRGLMLLIPHLGNWEMAGMLASARGTCTILYREPRLAALDEPLRELRRVGETQLVPASPKGVMAVLKTLQAGGMTIILPDQEPATQGGVFSDFFAVPAYTMTLVHRLQARTGARVLLSAALPQSRGFQLIYQSPDPEIYSADEQIAVNAMNRSIQALVEQAPEHYQWEYKRFRKRPPGTDKFYRVG